MSRFIRMHIMMGICEGLNRQYANYSERERKTQVVFDFSREVCTYIYTDPQQLFQSIEAWTVHIQEDTNGININKKKKHKQ